MYCTVLRYRYLFISDNCIVSVQTIHIRQLYSICTIMYVPEMSIMIVLIKNILDKLLNELTLFYSGNLLSSAPQHRICDKLICPTFTCSGML